MLATAAALGVAGLVAVALIVPSPRPGNPAASKPAASVQTARAPTMPAMWCASRRRLRRGRPEPLPAPDVLSVQPVAAAAEPGCGPRNGTSRRGRCTSGPTQQPEPAGRGAAARAPPSTSRGREGNWAKVVAGTSAAGPSSSIFRRPPPEAGRAVPHREYARARGPNGRRGLMYLNAPRVWTVKGRAVRRALRYFVSGMVWRASPASLRLRVSRLGPTDYDISAAIPVAELGDPLLLKPSMYFTTRTQR